jgi:hypothetical protein
MAEPHYSPGYSGWDVADQNKLFELIARGRAQPWPELLDVLPSGMLRPKKSLLAVFGLTDRGARAIAGPRPVPCARCSFSPCRYRRARYRPGAPRFEGPPASAPARSGRHRERGMGAYEPSLTLEDGAAAPVQAGASTAQGSISFLP